MRSDHDWYKANTTDQQATSISNNIYTNGRVGIAEINPQGQLQISRNVNGGSNGTQTPSLLIDQDVDHWMGGTLTTNAIKIDIDADGVEFGTNIINGINLNFNSNSVSGTGTYTGISSQGNSDNNELFTAGYFKATANNNGQAISLHTDGTVKMENIDLDDENSSKSLFLNSNNEVVYKSNESSSQCNVFYKEGFDVAGQIPAGWTTSPNSVYNQVGTQSCSNSTFDYKISRMIGFLLIILILIIVMS